MGSLGLLIVIFAQQLSRYFIGDDATTIAYTVQFIYLLGAMMPLLAVELPLAVRYAVLVILDFTDSHSAWPVGHAVRVGP